VLHRLTDLGNPSSSSTQSGLIRNADWIIDLGPEGGEEAPHRAQGTPEQVARVKKSYTGQALAGYLQGTGSGAHSDLQRVSNMTPAGYMAKRISRRPDWLKAVNVEDVYSISSCVSEDFGDYISNWKHNGYWFFDSPEIIKNVAKENSIRLRGRPFYYEAYEMEFDGESWFVMVAGDTIPDQCCSASRRHLEGFDAVSFSAGRIRNVHPCPATRLQKSFRYSHCSFESFDDAKRNLDNGSFRDAEFAPTEYFRVFGRLVLRDILVIARNPLIDPAPLNSDSQLTYR